MPKRGLTEESFYDPRDKKRVRISPAVGTSHEFNYEFYFSDEEYDQDECESSVGSNHPIHEVIVVSDNDDDEVESPSSKIDSSGLEDVAGGELQETKTGIELLRSQTVLENQCGERELTEVERKDCKEEEEDLNWWMEYGSMIVDNNGHLLGEYRRLDEELYMSITAIE